jgi:collagenase-like PrtC family protease
MPQRGYEFNYTLNGSCFGGTEYAPHQRKRILEFVDLLVQLGIGTLTVSLPSLIELLATNFPSLHVAASCILRTDSPAKAQTVEQLGARRIVLFEDVSRNFALLEAIRRGCSAQLEVLVNSPCVFGCLLRDYHYTLQSHGHTGKPGEDAFEGWFQRCNLRKLENPAEMVRARGLIRPEDIQHYATRGVLCFKIVGREARMENIAEIAAAYMRGRYEGNVFDLLPRASGARQAYYLDNRALDGFLNWFLERRNPCVTGCHNCGYCDRYASLMRPAPEAGDLRKAMTAMRKRIRNYAGRQRHLH